MIEVSKCNVYLGFSELLEIDQTEVQTNGERLGDLWPILNSGG